VFTARYALSPYIKQIGFVFKGLTLYVLLLSAYPHFTVSLTLSLQLVSEIQTVVSVTARRDAGSGRILLNVGNHIPYKRCQDPEYRNTNLSSREKFKTHGPQKPHFRHPNFLFIPFFCHSHYTSIHYCCNHQS
jgi:hypothetical protein